MKRQIILVTVLAVFMFSFATVYAQGYGQKAQMKAGDEFPELTSEQKDQMADLRSQHQKEMIPMRADLKVKQVEFRDMMRDDASQAELERKIDDIGRLKIEIRKMQLDHRLKMRAILTDEQREFLKDHPRWHRMMMDRPHKDGPREGMRKSNRGPRGFGFDCDDDFDGEALFEEAHFQGGGGRWHGDCPLN